MLLDTHVHLLASKKARPDWSEISYTLKVAKKRELICCALQSTEMRKDLKNYIERFLLKTNLEVILNQAGCYD